MKLSGNLGGQMAAGLAIGAATLAIALGSSTALAQGDSKPMTNAEKDKAAKDPSTKKKAPPAPSDKVDIWPEARDVLNKELEAVRALKSVQGSTTSLWENETEGQAPFKQEFPLDYAVEKPNKLFMNARDLKVYVDGHTVTVYSKFLKQYVQQPIPEIWLLRDTIEKISSGQIRNIPGEPILRPGMPLDQTLRGVASMERTRLGEYEGKSGTWVSGTGFDDRQPGSIPFTFERWYSDADGLIRVVKQDWTAMYQDLADRSAAEQSEGEAAAKKPQKFLRVAWTMTYKRELNPKLPPDTFTFQPSDGDKRVDTFVWARPNLKEQVAMIGRPCPPLAGTDFGSVDKDGKETAPQDVDISKLKGKIVVMDFWATWCGPCCAGLPSMQMIKDKYADKPFVLLGMNEEALSHSVSDPSGNAVKVRKFLERRKLDIQQFDDMPQKASRAFFVNSIPCVVILDKDGVIADIDVGYIPGKEKELMAKLDTLFAGKPLRTPEELQKLLEQVGINN